MESCMMQDFFFCEYRNVSKMLAYGPIKHTLKRIPFFLAVHNIEEALTMPRWMDEYQDVLRERVPFMEHLQFSVPQLYLSLILVTIIPAVVTWFCFRDTITKKKVLVLLTLQSIIFWNAVMPHVTGVLYLGMYNPGTVTAVLFNIPFSIALASTVLRSGIVRVSDLVSCMTIGAVLYLPLVYLNHLIAQGLASLI